MNVNSRLLKLSLIYGCSTIVGCGEYTPSEAVSAAENEVSASSGAGPCNSSSIYDGGYIRCVPSDDGYRTYLKQAVETPNMTVEMGAGNFDLSDDIWNVQSQVTIAGAGFGSTIIQRTTDRHDPMIKISGRAAVTLRDFTLEMNNTIGQPILSQDTHFLYVKRVEVRNATSDSFTVLNGSHVTFDGCIVNRTTSHGISFSSTRGPSEFGVEGFSIRNCQINDTDLSGINCANCTGASWSDRSEISNNTITYHGNHPNPYGGVRLPNAARYVDVKDNTVVNYTRGIFVLSKSRWNNIYRNSIHGGASNDQEGIVIQGPYNSVFCNTVFDMDRAALQIYGNTGLTSKDGPDHNNEIIFRHNLAVNQGHGEGNHPGHGVWISHSGNSTGHSTAYNSYNWDDYNSASDWFCSVYPFNDAQEYVNGFRATPTP
ncbi:MAG: right-handed parallel beta-helix repeat-containing protein [Myxococcota bacterium]